MAEATKEEALTSVSLREELRDEEEKNRIAEHGAGKVCYQPLCQNYAEPGRDHCRKHVDPPALEAREEPA